MALLTTQEGFVIPAGTAIVGNHWSIYRDPARFPEPDIFKPERWLEPRRSETAPWQPTSDKALRSSPGFGYGRRIVRLESCTVLIAQCPGQHVRKLRRHCPACRAAIERRTATLTFVVGGSRDQVANNSVFINVALVLWAFRLDEKPGRTIDTLAFTSTANSHPLDGMPIRFTPRFPGAVEQINALRAWV